MKKYLILILLVIINYNVSAQVSNTCFSQDYIIIKHIGVSNSPFLLLIIKKDVTEIKLSEEISDIAFSETISLASEKYYDFYKIINNSFLKDEVLDRNFGVFIIDIFEKGAERKCYLISRDVAMNYFNNVIKALYKGNFDNLLIKDFEMILEKLKINR